MTAKVAIVTGAAQGFGLEIAQDLVNQGACVILADLNIEAAEKEAKALQDKYIRFDRLQSYPWNTLLSRSAFCSI